jgi:hypothetical protein
MKMNRIGLTKQPVQFLETDSAGGRSRKLTTQFAAIEREIESIRQNMGNAGKIRMSPVFRGKNQGEVFLDELGSREGLMWRDKIGKLSIYSPLQKIHHTRHEGGGIDEINVDALAGMLADAQLTSVRRNSAAPVYTRQQLNFIEGANVTIGIADDAVNEEVDITIAAAVGAHNILSATHSDAAVDSVSRGSIIVGNATPEWDKLVVGAANSVLWSDGTDAAWSLWSGLSHDALGTRTHDGDTLQLDGVNSDGGAFTFATTGDVTFNENVDIDKAGDAEDIECEWKIDEDQYAYINFVEGGMSVANFGYDGPNDHVFVQIVDTLVTWWGGTYTHIVNTLQLETCVDAGTDVDKFLVLDGSDNVDYRTGAELRADIDLDITDSPQFAGLSLTGDLAMGGNSITGVNLVDGVDVSDHSARHENGGADEIDVGGLSGTLADPQTPAAHTHDGDTLQHDGVNSNGGAFAFDTTGTVTTNQTWDFPQVFVNDGDSGGAPDADADDLVVESSGSGGLSVLVADEETARQYMGDATDPDYFEWEYSRIDEEVTLSLGGETKISVGSTRTSLIASGATVFAIDGIDGIAMVGTDIPQTWDTGTYEAVMQIGQYSGVAGNGVADLDIVLNAYYDATWKNSANGHSTRIQLEPQNIRLYGSADWEVGTDPLYVELIDFYWGATAGSIVINDSGVDLDVRMETSNVATAFVLDAGADTLGVGVETTFAGEVNVSGVLDLADDIEMDSTKKIEWVGGTSFITDNSGHFLIASVYPIQITAISNYIYLHVDQVRTNSGTVGAPAWSYAGDGDSGEYRIGADNIGMSIGGSLAQEWESSLDTRFYGDVGIGRSPTSTKLEIQLDSDTVYDPTSDQKQGVWVYNYGNGGVDECFANLTFHVTNNSGSKNAVGSIAYVQKLDTEHGGYFSFRGRKDSGAHFEMLTMGPDDGSCFYGNVGISGIPYSALSFDDQTSTSTATPTQINMGGTYADTTGDKDKMKFVLYDGGSGNVSGIGLSSGHFEFHNSQAAMDWYYNEILKMDLSHSGTSTTLGIYGAEGGPAQLDLEADNGDDPADRWRIRSDHSTNHLYFRYNNSGTNSMYLSATGDFYAPSITGNLGSSSGDVVHIGGDQIAIDSSSRRYKGDIQVMDDAWSEQIWQLNPVTYRARKQTKARAYVDPSDKLKGYEVKHTILDELFDRREAGFIAEDAHDLGLSEFVYYDDKGAVISFNYRRYTAALHNELRKLRGRVAELEAAA